MQQNIENEDADIADGDSEPVVITTLKNEKYHCIYAPDKSNQVCSMAFIECATYIIMYCTCMMQMIASYVANYIDRGTKIPV